MLLVPWRLLYPHQVRWLATTGEPEKGPFNTCPPLCAWCSWGNPVVTTGGRTPLLVHATEEGMALRDKLLGVPAAVGGCVKLTEEEAKTLYRLLYKMLGGLNE